MKPINFFKKNIVIIIFIFLLITTFLFSYYFFLKNIKDKKENNLLKNKKKKEIIKENKEEISNYQDLNNFSEKLKNKEEKAPLIHQFISLSLNVIFFQLLMFFLLIRKPEIFDYFKSLLKNEKFFYFLNFREFYQKDFFKFYIAFFIITYNYCDPFFQHFYWLTYSCNYSFKLVKSKFYLNKWWKIIVIGIPLFIIILPYINYVVMYIAFNFAFNKGFFEKNEKNHKKKN